MVTFALIALSALASRDLAIVAAILAAGALYEVAYLRPRRDTHWILLDPLDGEPDGDD